MRDLIRWRGRIDHLGVEARRALMERSDSSDSSSVRDTVAGVIEAVRSRGDSAVRELTAQFDRVSIDQFEVPKPAWNDAVDRLDASLRRALTRAATNIARAHRAWLPVATTVETEPGIKLERRPYPLRRVGVYVPGGRASYPSSVLMGVVPAKAAGVPEVVICSPPGPNGRPADSILAAAELSGADRVFSVGGAQAIAALAIGTESIPRVDRIVGPGNAYVMEAKLALADRVGIDSPAGPSEVLVVATETTAPELVVAELIAQAEHDPSAAVVALVIGSDRAVAAIESALTAALAQTDRKGIVREALQRRGALLSAPSLPAAIAFANEFAPEHLLLAFDGAEAVAEQFAVAGAVFVGPSSSVVFGDYLTGANHVLPTAGLARSYSGLSPLDFVRWTTFQTVSPSAAARLAQDTITLATAERLPAHAVAAARWATETP